MTMSAVLGLIGAGGVDPSSPALNKVVINGRTSPGLAKISGASRPYKWQVEEGAGRGGAWMAYHGTGLCRFTLTLIFWEASHFREWATFKRVLEPSTKALPLAAGISHPILADLGVTQAVFESVGQLTKQDSGTWTIEIACIERAPFRDELWGVKGGKPSVTNDENVVTAKTAADRALEAGLIEMQRARVEATYGSL